MIYTLTLNPAVDREYRVPALIPNDVLRATTVRNDPGGKGFNVSRMISQLGGTTTAAGFVGGTTGQWLADSLSRLGIETNFIKIDSETRTNTTIVSNSEDHYFKVNESGPTLAEADIGRLIELVEREARPDEWWVLAGSLPGGCPPDLYATLTRILQKAGSRVFLDASGGPLVEGCAAGPEWIKPNDDEAREITGEADPLAAGRALRRRGIKNVIVSQGRDGSLYLSDQTALRIHPLSIIENNPIGAGDAFVGGLVYQLQRGAAPEVALRWATASGAAAASLPGTAFGSRDQVEKLAADVHIEAIDLD